MSLLVYKHSQIIKIEKCRADTVRSHTQSNAKMEANEQQQTLSILVANVYRYVGATIIDANPIFVEINIRRIIVETSMQHRKTEKYSQSIDICYHLYRDNTYRYKKISLVMTVEISFHASGYPIS